MVSPAIARSSPRSGGFLLLPVAALAVHQLRYWLAYGPRANAELAAQGHSYLHSLVPWTIFALAVGAGLFLRRAAAALRTGEPGPMRLSRGGIWVGTWAALLAVYALQETLEGLVSTGHPGGAGGVFGHGGWWAVPVSAAVALLVTAVLVLGRAVLRIAAGAATRLRLRARAAVLLPADVAVAVVRPLARAAAGRAPPPRLLPR